MKTKLLKNLRRDASNAITMEYEYPNYKVVIYAIGYQTNGIIVIPFSTLKEAKDYMNSMRRSYIINTARLLSRMGGRKIY